MLSVLAVVVSLALLMWLAYRGVTVLLLAPLMGALAVLLSGEARWLLPLYTDTFMSALGSYVLQYLPLFLLGALFGRLMADSGAASTLARWIVRTLGERHANGKRAATFMRVDISVSDLPRALALLHALLPALEAPPGTEIHYHADGHHLCDAIHDQGWLLAQAVPAVRSGSHPTI